LHYCILHGNKAWNVIAAGYLSDINVHLTCFANNIVDGKAIAYVANLGGGKSGNNNFGMKNSSCNGFYLEHRPGCRRFKSDACQSTLRDEIPMSSVAASLPDVIDEPSEKNVPPSDERSEADAPFAYESSAISTFRVRFIMSLAVVFVNALNLI